MPPTNEPARLAELVRLFLIVLVAFGVPVTTTQVDAVVALVAALALAAASWGITAWVRSRVTPVAAPKLPQGTVVVATDPDTGTPIHTDTVR